MDTNSGRPVPPTWGRAQGAAQPCQGSPASWRWVSIALVLILPCYLREFLAKLLGLFWTLSITAWGSFPLTQLLVPPPYSLLVCPTPILNLPKSLLLPWSLPLAFYPMGLVIVSLGECREVRLESAISLFWVCFLVF